MSGHVQARGDGKWRIFVDDGRDPITGRRRRITRTFAGTRRDAEREAEKFVTKVRDGGHGAAVTTFGALLDAWLIQTEHDLERWSIYHYRAKVERYIRPALGDLKLRQVTTARLDAFYRALVERGARPRAKTPETAVGLSPQTVHHIHAIIRRACDQGCAWGWLDRNPATLAKPPKVAKRVDVLPEVGEILKIADRLTIDMREIAWVAIVTGARRGELCGLRWGTDIDLEHGQITIRRSIADLPAELVVKGTKTGHERSLAIDAATVQLLVGRHTRQAEKATTFGVTLAPDAYVFADAPGAAEPLKPQRITQRWSRAAEAAGIKCRFHDLRHFAVTELLEAGFEVGGVAKRVGHASTKMTQDRYQHARGTGDLAAAEHLAGLISN